MENDPIDRLFAEKLRHLEETPDPSVWNRLQANQLSEKRHYFVRYGIAASVSALLLVMGLVGRHQNRENRVEAGRETRVAFHPPVWKGQQAAPRIEDRSERIAQSANEEQRAIHPIRKKPKFRVSVATQPKDAIPEERITRLPEQPPVIQPLLAMEESLAERAAVVVVRIAEPRDPVISGLEPAAATRELVSTKAKKRTRAGKIIQQLKNLKNGEKVDWKEVGIRPEGILARSKLEGENQK